MFCVRRGILRQRSHHGESPRLESCPPFKTKKMKSLLSALQRHRSNKLVSSTNLRKGINFRISSHLLPSNRELLKSSLSRSFADSSKAKPPISFDKKMEPTPKENQDKAAKKKDEESAELEDIESEDPQRWLKPPKTKISTDVEGIDPFDNDSILYRRIEWDEGIRKDYNLDTGRGLLMFAAVIGLIAYYDQYWDDLQDRYDVDTVTTEELVLRDWEIELLKRVPWRLISRAWGYLVHSEVPVSQRASLYSWYARMYGCNLKEMRDPITSYPTFADFFARRLKDGARPLADGFISPVDGTVLHFGEIKEGAMEQVKGLSYSLKAFLGESHEGLKRFHETRPPGKKLYHCIIYLAPGDYHGVHSPVNWTISQTTHLPGTLLPVKPSFVSLVRGLFALNERVALAGEWEHGFFSLTPVGATNVGSIALSFDEEFKSNSWVMPRKPDTLQKQYVNDKTIRCNKGDEIAFFHMGSTVVLIFESPEFIFNVSKGQKVRLGQRLGQPLPEQFRRKHFKPALSRAPDLPSAELAAALAIGDAVSK
eukprot:TRINITY_DN6566_c0_g1_i1.p1 TRINITY_DN6566_c0_g1~~TRINITY_DN6566_c0_g1_i1.p1  ORF type:complete len:538 (+),score=66.34 TRINITY_DN6566_c0_g1_i1:580-2193(+)